MFNDGDEAVSYDSDMYLDSDSILIVSVELLDMKMLFECDAICMMDGWEQSKGCKLELDVASSCGLTVYYESDVRTIQER